MHHSDLSGVVTAKWLFLVVVCGSLSKIWPLWTRYFTLLLMIHPTSILLAMTPVTEQSALWGTICNYTIYILGVFSFKPNIYNTLLNCSLMRIAFFKCSEIWCSFCFCCFLKTLVSLYSPGCQRVNVGSVPSQLENRRHSLLNIIWELAVLGGTGFINLCFIEVPHMYVPLFFRVPERTPKGWKRILSFVVITALFFIHQLHKQKTQKTR